MAKYRIIHKETGETHEGFANELAGIIYCTNESIYSAVKENWLIDKVWKCERISDEKESRSKIKMLIGDEKLIECIEAGMTYKEISETYGIEIRKIRQYCADHGYVYKNKGKLKKVTANNYWGSSDKICPECLKKFNCYNVAEWGWSQSFKGARYYFCSYSCMRKFEKEKL